jgi:hypothetical protein
LIFISDLQSKFKSGFGLFWLKDSNLCPIPKREKDAWSRPFSEAHHTQPACRFNTDMASTRVLQDRSEGDVAQKPRFCPRPGENAAIPNGA